MFLPTYSNLEIFLTLLQQEPDIYTSPFKYPMPGKDKRGYQEMGNDYEYTIEQ